MRAAPEPTSSAGIRVNLTLPHEVVAVLDRMGKVTGIGRATFVRQFLVEAAPQFSEMARALELAQEKNLDAFKVLSQVVEGVRDQSEQLSLDIRSHRRKVARKRVAK